MKTRTGFVSNSSSSSFIAYGVPVTRDELQQITSTQLLAVDADKLIAAIRKCRWSPDEWTAAANAYEQNGDKTAFVNAITDEDYIHELFDSNVLDGLCSVIEVGGVTSFEEDIAGAGTNFLIGQYKGIDEGEITSMSEATRHLGVDNELLTSLCDISNLVGRDHDLFFGTRYN